MDSYKIEFLLGLIRKSLDYSMIIVDKELKYKDMKVKDVNINIGKCNEQKSKEQECQES